MAYYVMFDGDEIDGKRYALGDEVDAPASVVEVLVGLGRLSSTRPALDTDALPLTTVKPVEDMTRSELETAAMDAMRSRMGDASDDDLRRMVFEHRRADELDQPEPEPQTPTTPADKPLDEMSATELDAVAAAEGVDVSKARTKSDRVAAIEEARIAKRG